MKKKLILGIIFLLAKSIIQTEQFYFLSPQNNQIRAIADATLLRRPDPTLDDNIWDRGWDWGRGTLMWGMEAVWKYTQDEKYYRYIKEDYIDKFIQDENSRIPIPAEPMEGFCPGWVLLMVYEKTYKYKYIKAMNQLLDVWKNTSRSTEGGLLTLEGYYWIDSLFCYCPVFARLAKITKEEKYYDEAVNQLLIQGYRLKDPLTGLFYHFYDFSKGDPKNYDGLWGRGNGWIIMAMIEVLDLLPLNHSKRKELIKLYKEQVEGLKKYQHSSGLWYTVIDKIDDKRNYLEVSVTAMCVYAIAKGIRIGILDKKTYWPIVEKGMKALLDKIIIDPKGNAMLTEISRGTGKGSDYTYYFNIKQGNDYDWGVGPFLLANVEMLSIIPGIDKEIKVNKKDLLYQNYPNPFNPECWIPYTIDSEGLKDVEIKIYNVLGQLIRQMNLGNKVKGEYLTKDKAAYWDGRDNYGKKVSSGIYFYRLEVDGKIIGIKKNFVLK